MSDGKQWYNSPQEGPSKKNDPKGKPSASSGKQVSGTGRPVGKQMHAASGKKPVQKSGKNISSSKPGMKSRPENKQAVKTEKSIIPQMDPLKTSASAEVKNETKAVQKKPGMTAKKHAVKTAPAPAASSARTASSAKPVSSKERARAKEQEKILEQKRRKEQAKLKEQEKIEKNEHNRKNPSQKSAESRAIRNGLLGAVAVAAALLVLVFVVHHLFDYIAEKPKFSFVTTGAVEHTIGARALIVRDEDTISSDKAGELVTQITEGSRVARDQKVAIVVPDNMRSVVTDLRNVQSQISDVQQELILDGGVAEADTIYRNYNKNLSAILDSVRFDAMSGNLNYMYSYSSSVNVILDERDDEMSRIDFDDERITVLRANEKVYEAQVENDAAVIAAHRPGIVSFRLDGSESDLDYESFLTMPADQIKAYINSSVGAISSDLSVTANTPAVRIAQNESQYLTVYLSANDAAASDFKEGTVHDINVRTEGLSMDNCKVVRCESDASGTLITFETSRYVEDLLDLRTVDIEIVITETNGMRVSVPSLVNADYAPKGNPAFCVYFAPGAAVGTDTFTEEAVFNITILPNEKLDDDGNVVEQQKTNVPGCKVVHTEFLENGGTIVAFATPNDYSGLKKLDRIYTTGYTASFVDSATGLGMTCEKISVSEYSGMASVYVNNQGFVEEVRVIVLDNDREFAIIDQIGNSSVPNLDTVIITNPKTVKPGDKVD